MQRINGDQYCPQATRKFVDFVRVDWEPVMLPTMKYATQKSYAYFLRVHLIPALGDFRLRDVIREPIQTMLNAKLAAGLGLGNSPSPAMRSQQDTWYGSRVGVH